MNKVLFLLFFPVLISVAGLGQQAIVLPDSPSHTIVSQYALLPDNGYSFGQVLTDTSLHFVENDSVRLQKATVYWLRLQLKQPSHYAGEYRCWLRTPMHNTLYYFNADSNAWVHNEAGVAPGANGQMVQDGLPCLLQGNNHLNTVYIKMDLQAAHSAAVAFAPQVIIKKQAAVDYMDNFLFISWVCSIVMLFLFFLNHLYLYYSLKDRTVWYYLITLVGGMIYITLHKRVLL